MKFRWAAWSFGIALAALVCYADEPEKTATRSRVMTKQSNDPPINLTFPGCGKRPPKSHPTPQLIDKRLSRRDSEIGLSSSHKKGEVLNIANDREEKIVDKRRGHTLPVIVGGVEAVPNSWPWMAALFVEMGKGREFFCGGSLISKYYVLTAAHCFSRKSYITPSSNIVVILGAHDPYIGAEYVVSEVKMHQDFNTTIFYNDLALLRLAKAVSLTNHIYPVCLPSNDLKETIIPNQTNVTAIGWGKTENSSVAEKLREVTLPIVLEDCNLNTRITNPNGIQDDLICAGVIGGRATCSGDSGSPMMLKLDSDVWMQVALTSLGKLNCEKGTRLISPRLSSYTRWFYENTDLGKNLSLKVPQ